MRKVFLFLALSCRVWAGYGHSYAITVTNPTASTLTDFPLMVCANWTTAFCDSGAHVNLAVPGFKGTGSAGQATNASGYDIGYSSDSGCTAMLSYWFDADTYVSATGVGVWWVKVTLVSGSSTPLYACVGNAAITTDQSSTAAWNADIRRRYGLANGSTLNLTNSTATSATLTAGANTIAAAGWIDGGSSCNCSASSAFSATVTGLPTSGAFSLSIWMKSTNTANSIAHSWGADVTDSFHEVYINLNGNGTGKVAIGDQAAYGATSSTTTNNDGNWHHVVATYSGSGGTHTSTIYVDGVSRGTSTTSLTLSTAPTQLRIFGLANDNSNLFPFVGSLDEARVYAVELSADWAAADYANQSAPWNFYTFGADTPTGSTSAPRRVISF